MGAAVAVTSSTVISKAPTRRIMPNSSSVASIEAILVPRMSAKDSSPAGASESLPRFSTMSARSPPLQHSANVEVREAPVPTSCFSRRAMSHFWVGACGFLFAPSWTNGAAGPRGAAAASSASSSSDAWRSESNTALYPASTGTDAVPRNSGESTTCAV